MKHTFALLALPVTAAAALFFSGLPVCAQTDAAGSFKGPLGLQLYSLRNQFAKDVPGSLDTIKSFGIKYGELAGTYNQTPEAFKEQMLARGIVPISGHFAYDKFRDNPEDIAKEAEALGLKFAGCAWIPHKGDFDEKTCREAIAIFNHAGEVLAKHGIRFFYHTHGYEFLPYGDSNLFDLLLKETNPKTVSYEMDIFWIQFAGQSPAGLLAKYPNRWELMHLKDMRKGLKTGSSAGGTDTANDVTIGTGQIDIPGVLAAAKKVGVKYYFIEDESPTSVQQIPDSIKYLNAVQF